MATYTGDSVDKLRKQDLTPIVLSLKSKLEDKKYSSGGWYVKLKSQFQS